MNLPDFLTQDRHGFVHIAGHRIGLRHVIELYQNGSTPEMVHDHFPTLPLAVVYKVIAFSLENRADVDAYIRQGREAVDQQAAATQTGLNAAELRRRMEAQRPKESA